MNEQEILNLEPGDQVILLDAPASLLSELPLEDQSAILDAVGKNVSFVDFDEGGRIELAFADNEGAIHTVWVEKNSVAIG